jgi:transcription termination factor Rho
MHPEQQIRLETDPEEVSTRIIDMMCPIGKGTRGLIVAPPRSGKTVLLQQIAHGISVNHPEIELMVLLVDERPEEVTAMKRSVQGEVIASSNDMDLKNHIRLSTLAIEKAKRLVEHGKDVVVLLDSLTRLSRAFNNYVSGSGRTMSGGVDARALEIPRRMFAAARNCEGHGSLTIVATALIETGSRMDDLIFQEFKGTGNMEMVLDRQLAEQRIFPAIDIRKSGTRKEELLLGDEMTDAVARLRRELADLPLKETMDALINAMRRSKTNAELLKQLGARRF